MKILTNNLQVAIDGPVAAGKGTVSKLLAEKLGILYIDTGAMYRALAYFVKQNSVDWNNEPKISDLLKAKNPKVSLFKPEKDKKDGRLITVILDNEDISWKIRTEEISQGVSIITRYKSVRDYMVPRQQTIARATHVVMEGRDITTRVLPNASLKIYMDASEDTRANRRFQQLMEKGELTTLEKVKADLHQRDERDMNRKLDPLTRTKDAWYFDTTNFSIPQVVEIIENRLIENKLIE